MTTLENAQKELDVRISDYYLRNKDGGNYEERYVISQRIANIFHLDLVDAEKLNF